MMIDSNASLKILANTIRGLSMDGVQAANSGHPGLPMGMADVGAVLWSQFLKFNPENPNWFNRDRFVLSGGHGSMLLYSLLHLFGYDLPLDELKNFRQWGSKTPGHPEYKHTPGVETTTGPLGQGLSNAVGMALAEASLAARFNSEDHQVINHYTYVFAGDGDMQEGISHEACAFAGHNKLGKLVLFYDDNKISIDGKTELSFSEDVLKRFEAYGWHVASVDGHDYDEISAAIVYAQTVLDKPSIIACRTIIGYGSPNRAGTPKAHGEPLGTEEIKLTKENLDLPVDKDFYVDPEMGLFAAIASDNGQQLEEEWDQAFAAYKEAEPETAAKLMQAIKGKLPAKALDIPAFEAGKAMATRAASGKVLDHLAPLIPALIGGSADLTPSNKTFPKSETAFSPENPTGRYIHYGIREHGMAAIMNGMALHGGVLPYSGTFFVFSDYMRPSLRLAALMGIPAIHVLTHDSIGLGEDGPTHQPVEQLAALRAIPNLSVIRPMDANETAVAWKMALQQKSKPTCLALTRQGIKTVERGANGLASASGAEKGAYVLTEDPGFDALVIATGSEVEIALEAKKIINEKGGKVRIVSMPSIDFFEEQSQAYQESVLPKDIEKRVVIEAGSSLSWYKFVGPKGKIIGIDRFGLSAPYKLLYEKFGITAEALAEAVLA